MVHAAAPQPSPVEAKEAPENTLALVSGLVTMLRDDMRDRLTTDRNMVDVLRDLRDVCAGLRDELAHMRRGTA